MASKKNQQFEFDDADEVKAKQSIGREKQKEPLYEAISARLDKEKVKGPGFLVTLADAKKRRREDRRNSEKNPLTLTGFKGNVKVALDNFDDGKHKGKFSVEIADTEEEQLIIKRIAAAGTDTK